ncbi:hypothetical protein HK096_006569 [Nowakowskiella sp. JEL0078]|nr:hypothetical protein HK096_006569 [Nowakowskiella sp. JEL0078]
MTYNRFPVFHFGVEIPTSNIDSLYLTPGSPMCITDEEEENAYADDEQDDEEYSDNSQPDQFTRKYIQTNRNSSKSNNYITVNNYVESEEPNSSNFRNIISGSSRSDRVTVRQNSRQGNTHRTHRSRNNGIKMQESDEQRKHTPSSDQMEYSINEYGYVASVDLAQLQAIPIQPRKTPSSPIIPIITQQQQDRRSLKSAQDWKVIAPHNSPSGSNYNYMPGQTTTSVKGRPPYGTMIQQQLNQPQIIQQQQSVSGFILTGVSNNKPSSQ